MGMRAIIIALIVVFLGFFAGSFKGDDFIIGLLMGVLDVCAAAVLIWYLEKASYDRGYTEGCLDAVGRVLAEQDQARQESRPPYFS